jgi:hypothetical protein
LIIFPKSTHRYCFAESNYFRDTLTPNADSQFASVASLRSVSYLFRNNWSSLERNLTALTWVLENGLPARFGLIRQAISYCGLCSAQREVSGL